MTETKVSDLVDMLVDTKLPSTWVMRKAAADEIKSLHAQLAVAETRLKIAKEALEKIAGQIGTDVNDMDTWFNQPDRDGITIEESIARAALATYRGEWK